MSVHRLQSCPAAPDVSDDVRALGEYGGATGNSNVVADVAEDMEAAGHQGMPHAVINTELW
eukprot:767841-Hanusia_phi.AAC.3